MRATRLCSDNNEKCSPGDGSQEASSITAVVAARPPVHIEALNSSAPATVSPKDDERNIEELEQENSDRTELELKVLLETFQI